MYNLWSYNLNESQNKAVTMTLKGRIILPKEALPLKRKHRQQETVLVIEDLRNRDVRVLQGLPDLPVLPGRRVMPDRLFII